MNKTYLDTARFLTRVAPRVFADDTFSLKGGTAINLIISDMPRLSVDPDLVFPDYSLPRDAALARINEAIRQSAERLTARGFKTHALAAPDAGETKLLVRRGGIEVMIDLCRRGAALMGRFRIEVVRRVLIFPLATATGILLALSALLLWINPLSALDGFPVTAVIFPRTSALSRTSGT